MRTTGKPVESTRPVVLDDIDYDILLPEVTIRAPKAKRSFWEQFNLDRREEHKELAKSPSGALWAGISSLFELPQAYLSYLGTKYFSKETATKPSLALGQDPNSLAGMGLDILLDVPLVGAPSKVSKASKATRVAEAAPKVTRAAANRFGDVIKKELEILRTPESRAAMERLGVDPDEMLKRTKIGSFHGHKSFAQTVQPSVLNLSDDNLGYSFRPRTEGIYENIKLGNKNLYKTYSTTLAHEMGHAIEGLARRNFVDEVDFTKVPEADLSNIEKIRRELKKIMLPKVKDLGVGTDIDPKELRKMYKNVVPPWINDEDIYTYLGDLSHSISYATRPYYKIIDNIKIPESNTDYDMAHHLVENLMGEPVIINTETIPHLRELKRSLFNLGFTKSYHDVPSVGDLREFANNAKAGLSSPLRTGSRFFISRDLGSTNLYRSDIYYRMPRMIKTDDQSLETLRDLLRYTPAVGVGVGAGALMSGNSNGQPTFAYGGSTRGTVRDIGLGLGSLSSLLTLVNPAVGQVAGALGGVMTGVSDLIPEKRVLSSSPGYAMGGMIDLSPLFVFAPSEAKGKFKKIGPNSFIVKGNPNKKDSEEFNIPYYA